MKNLYIVKNSLQLINAVEAKEHFKCKNNTLILIYANDINKTQIESILNHDEWDEIFILDHTATKSLYWHYIKLIRSLKKHSFAKLFVGYFRGIKKIIISNLHAHEIYLLDDGVATLDVQKKLPDLLRSQKVFKDLKYKLFGLKTSISTLPNWFTAYEIHPYPNQKIVINRYNHLKTVFMKNPHMDLDHVYLLGQSLTENSIMNIDDYINVIRTIKNNLSDQNIVYIPHRFEHATVLEEIRKLEDNSFQVKQSNEAVELSFLKNDVYPKYIISFFTSALFTLEKIFGESDLYAFRIDPELIHRQNEAIEACYRTMESNSSIRVIDGDDLQKLRLS